MHFYQVYQASRILGLASKYGLSNGSENCKTKLFLSWWQFDSLSSFLQALYLSDTRTVNVTCMKWQARIWQSSGHMPHKACRYGCLYWDYFCGDRFIRSHQIMWRKCTARWVIVELVRRLADQDKSFNSHRRALCLVQFRWINSAFRWDDPLQHTTLSICGYETFLTQVYIYIYNCWKKSKLNFDKMAASMT